MKLEAKEIDEILEKVGTDAWNKSISSRLESLQGYLSQDEWNKGISIWLRALIGNALIKLLEGKSSPSDVDYVRGFVQALRLVISLPKTVETEISKENSRSKQESSRGNAGY